MSRRRRRGRETTAALYDGQTGDAVTAITTTLKAALDGRDAIVAAINAMTDKSGYARVLAAINDDATDEADDIADALADDELTDEAKAALNAAATQVAATAPRPRRARRRLPGRGDDATTPGSAATTTPSIRARDPDHRRAGVRARRTTWRPPQYPGSVDRGLRASAVAAARYRGGARALQQFFNEPRSAARCFPDAPRRR